MNAEDGLDQLPRLLVRHDPVVLHLSEDGNDALLRIDFNNQVLVRPYQKARAFYTNKEYI